MDTELGYAAALYLGDVDDSLVNWVLLYQLFGLEVGSQTLVVLEAHASRQFEVLVAQNFAEVRDDRDVLVSSTLSRYQPSQKQNCIPE